MSNQGWGFVLLSVWVFCFFSLSVWVFCFVIGFGAMLAVWDEAITLERPGFVGFVGIKL
jgi:hypothetical protein